MAAFKKTKEVKKKVVVIDAEKQVKKAFPKCELKKSGEKIIILAEKKGKVLAIDKNADNAWKKALHSIS